MNKIDRIHGSKQARRPHYIPQWAEKRGLKQADIAAELGADKSLVSRWFAGATPREKWQEALAALFGFEGEPEIIFRHPDEDWLSRFFAGRRAEEIERIKATLETAFPRHG